MAVNGYSTVRESEVAAINNKDDDNRVVFRLSPCCECRVDSFGYFPGVKFLLTDVSETSVISIIKGANEDCR
jgi:hypothetical protein